jgi:HEAT repeat protein
MLVRVEQLITVRSQPVEALLAYFRAMQEELARNPLLDRFGRRLDDLLVPLRVVPYEPVRDIEEVRAREHFRYTGASPESNDADSHGPRRVWAFRGTSFDDQPAARAMPERLDKLEPQLRMAVLLGDPGSGKTEWLKYRARHAMREAREQVERRAVWLADLRIPAYLRLRDVAAALEQESALRDFLAETGCVPSRPATLRDAECAAAAVLRALIQHYHLPERLAPWVWKKLTRSPQAGTAVPALLYLDAWDEVRSGQETLARCLNAFAQATRARLFLTSRISGYSHRPLPVQNTGDGPHREVQLCPFTWKETETFVTVFFRDDPARGQRMRSELRDKIAIAGMAQNPLLTTLLCLAFSPNSARPPLGFPARRVEVYERVLTGLLGEWEAIDKRQRPPKGLMAAKMRVLEEIAYHFFPDEALTEDRLNDFLWNENRGYMTKLLPGHPLHQLATTLQEEICNDGILVPCGGTDALTFLHLTFEEYLTARALARRLESPLQQPGENGRITHPLWQFVDKKAWLPEWQETLVLLAGMLHDPGPLLELLIDQTKDDYFRHRLALAALCLPELVSKVPHAKCEVREKINHITTTAFSLWWRNHEAGIDAATPHLTRTLPALGQVNGRMEGLPLLEWLCQRLRMQTGVRQWALVALGQIGIAVVEYPEVHAELVAVALHDADGNVHWQAARVLGQIGAAMAEYPEIFTALITALNDVNQEVRRRAVEVLGQMGTAMAEYPEIFTALITALNDVNQEVRRRAVEVLGQIGTAMAGQPEIFTALTTALYDADSGVRYRAARALGQMGLDVARQPGVLTALVNVSIRDAVGDVRYRAARELGGIGVAGGLPEVLTALATAWQDADAKVRYRVEDTLEEIRKTMEGQPEVSTKMMAIALRDTSRERDGQAVKASGSLGVATGIQPELLATWATALQDVDSNVRRRAEGALERMGVAVVRQSEVLAKLIAMAPQGMNSWVRRRAIEALGAIGSAMEGQPEVLTTLTATLRDEDTVVRYWTIEAFGQMGAAVAREPEVLTALTAALQDTDAGVRQRAAGVLGQMGAAVAREPEVLAKLIAIALRDTDAGLRERAVVALGQMGAAVAREPEVLTALTAALQDTDAGVRQRAVGVLGQMREQGVRIFQQEPGKVEGNGVEKLANQWRRVTNSDEITDL